VNNSGYMRRLALTLLAAAALRGCVAYEYEHEFWIRVDGSGTVNVTGRPELWTAFKGVPVPAESDAARAAARRLFEESGLRVRRVTVTRRGGRPYLFVSADFDDVNRLAGTVAFADLRLALRPDGERLRLEGTWSPPGSARGAPADDGQMAVRFHLPSKVYEHRNAMDGVERGNIVGWRQDVRAALLGGSLDFGALIDRRSILVSTIGLFAAAIALALSILAGVILWVRRRGARVTAPAPRSPPAL
jgi:8-oxo-dGTP pyrophosphatase MutT (NUDIX family)